MKNIIIIPSIVLIIFLNVGLAAAQNSALVSFSIDTINEFSLGTQSITLSSIIPGQTYEADAFNYSVTTNDGTGKKITVQAYDNIYSGVSFGFQKQGAGSTVWFDIQDSTNPKDIAEVSANSAEKDIGLNVYLRADSNAPYQTKTQKFIFTLTNQ